MLNYLDDKTSLLFLINVINNRLECLSECNLKKDSFNKGQYFAYNACLKMVCTHSNISFSSNGTPVFPKDLSSKDVLIYIIHELCCRLDKLRKIKISYVNGLKTAYVECLEVIRTWNESALYGINFDIEALYPIR